MNQGATTRRPTDQDSLATASPPAGDYYGLADHGASACHAARAESDLGGLVAMFGKILDDDPAYDF